MAFLKRSDKARYGQLLTDLKNQYSRGTDQYPETVTEAYNLLVSYKKPENTRPLRPGGGGNNRNNLRPGGGNNRDTDAQDQDATFVQAGGNTPISEITCYNCQQMGHYAGDCTKTTVQRGRPPETEVTLLMTATETEDYEDDDDDVE